MSAETDLLPLPERFSFMEWETHMRDYARANLAELQREVEGLRFAGTLLSNIAYNLAQDDRLPESTRWSLDDARKKWDQAAQARAALEQENDDA